jgi:hypothetical protein
MPLPSRSCGAALNGEAGEEFEAVAAKGEMTAGETGLR